jgi:serine/threonine-protein kinase RsbW
LSVTWSVLAQLQDRQLYEGSLPAEPASVGTLRRGLDAAIAPLALAAQRRGDIGLVASEAMTNAVLHAYVDMATGPVGLSAAVSDGSLRVTVRDEGRGMMPRDDSPGMGLGIGLMGSLSDGLEITSIGRGTEICLSFVL